MGYALDGGLLIAAHRRYACLDLLDTDLVQQLGYAHLLKIGENDACRLLPVPEGGIADHQLSLRQFREDISFVPHFFVSHIVAPAPHAQVPADTAGSSLRALHKYVSSALAHRSGKWPAFPL